MKLHPRTLILQQAEAELSTFFTSLIDRYNISWAELHHLIHTLGQRWSKWHLTDERDEEKEENDRNNRRDDRQRT